MSNTTIEKPRNMPTNEEGEFELVLGNKQLLSVFFIVIILLGVFFTIGYLLGRSSGPTDIASKKPTEAPVTRESVTPMPKTGGHTPARVVVDKPSANKPIEVSPAKQVSTPAAAAPAPEKSLTVEKKAPPAVPQKTMEIPAVSSAPNVTQPQPGMYIQVLALGKPEAEVLADVLAKKGFHAMVAPGPNEKLFRVLVGPAKDAGDVGRLKGDLEKAGFKDAFPKKY